ncbi:MAG: alpha/beta hydrolase [Thiolinea sp.]
MAWDHWEATVMGTPPRAAETDPQQQWQRIHSKRIYAHYCHHQFFLGPAGVFPGLDALTAIPVTLLHGQHDQVCPLPAAQALAEALPRSELIVTDAGHSLQAPAMRAALWDIVTR